MTHSQKAQVQLLFGTPLWRLSSSSLLSDSLDRIATHVKADVSSGKINSKYNKSNFLGSQSLRCPLRECPYLNDSERHELLKMIQSALPLKDSFRIISWINCSPANSHNTAHVHPGFEISGVFYIAVPPESGLIVFRDPRPQSEMSLLSNKASKVFSALSPRVPLSPEPGDLILFPSWLMHQVEPGSGQQGLRISMALNITGLREFE